MCIGGLMQTMFLFDEVFLGGGSGTPKELLEKKHVKGFLSTIINPMAPTIFASNGPTHSHSGGWAERSCLDKS